MRRLLLLIPILLVAAAAVFVLNRGGSDEAEPSAAAGLTADVMPFPSSTKPLPVPQLRIASGPWADALPDVPTAKLPPAPTPRGADELKRCVVQIPRFSEELPTERGGQFKTCADD